jgi:hypothetical protein
VAREGIRGPRFAAGLAVAAVMTASLAYGFAFGELGEEGSRLIAMPWGLVTVVEVYAGIALFSGWIWARERSPAVAGGWVLALCVLGNVIAGIYVALAAARAGGNTTAFWLGPGR